MISRPEDRPKAILLVVAIVAVLVFVVWNLKKALSANEVVTQPVPQPSGTLVPPTNLGNGVTTGQPDNGYYAQFQPSTSTSDPAQVDPFRSPLPRATTIANIGEGTSSSSNNGSTSLQPIDRGSGIPLSIDQVQSSIQLKGIVSGAGSPMAVLRIGETTYNLFAGERITKDLSVVRITPTMCELSYFKMPIRLVIGQAKMASVTVPKPKGTPRGLVAEPVHVTTQPVEIVPNITELPDNSRANPTRSTETKPAPVQPPTPRDEPRREPKPAATINPPRTEVKPPEPTTSQPMKPTSPSMGPI